MKKKVIFSSIIVLAAGLLAFFLFPKTEKKVQFNKNQENVNNINLENNNTPAESVGAENVPEDNPSTDSNNSPVVENKTEDVSKKDEPANSPKITNKLAGWGYEKASNRKIDTIVIHSTYNITSSDPFDLDAIIYKEYKPYGVAPHYIIDRDGKIYRLVEDKNIAYHAGESKMPDGRTGVNNFSIGIELVNSKTAKPTGEQYSSLKYLIGYIKGKYSIKYTLGHRDIATGRKDDPWNFDWGKIK